MHVRRPAEAGLLDRHVGLQAIGPSRGLPIDGKIGTSLVAVTEIQAGDAAETWLRAPTAGARGWVVSRPGEDAI
jgi:hypothetical protein